MLSGEKKSGLQCRASIIVHQGCSLSSVPLYAKATPPPPHPPPSLSPSCTQINFQGTLWLFCLNYVHDLRHFFKAQSQTELLTTNFRKRRNNKEKKTSKCNVCCWSISFWNLKYPGSLGLFYNLYNSWWCVSDCTFMDVRCFSVTVPLWICPLFLVLNAHPLFFPTHPKYPC